MSRTTTRIFLAALAVASHGLAQQADSGSATPVNVVPQQPARAVLPGEAGSTVDKRAYGVIPNYRTAELDAPFIALTNKQKLTIGFKDSTDWPPYITGGLFAGISQLNNSNPSFGQGLKGYAKRYAASVADQDIGNMMTESIMPILLHEDPRFFRKAHGSVKSRIFYAASRVVVTKGNSGNWQFNAAEFLGNGVVASIGNIYYPDDKGFSATMQRMFTQIATDAISQVAKEFWPDLKRIVTRKRGDSQTD